MNEQELNSLLITEIENQNIDYRLGDWNNQSAWISPLLKLGGYTKNARPFDHAHELSHILNNDDYRSGDCDIINPNESRAHREAILILWNMFEKQGGSYFYFNLFVEITGCPYDLAYLVISKEHNDQLGELNEFGDDIIVDEDELRKYAVEYISSFDVLDNLEVYRFLDLYHLAYSLYDKAVGVFHDLLHHDLKFGY